MLWDVLASAHRRLGFDAVDDRVFEYLVLDRLVEPTSKADSIRVFTEVGVPDAPSLRSIWRSLATSVENDWRSKIATAADTHAPRNGPLTLVLYDVTTLYFGAALSEEFGLDSRAVSIRAWRNPIAEICLPKPTTERRTDHSR